MSTQLTGAILERAPSDWQIIQQDENGYGAMHLAGRWIGRAGGRVQVRLVTEDASTPLPGLDWQNTQTSADGTWKINLKKIPTGGLYRLETRYNDTPAGGSEWSPRGDMRHFLGVGDLWLIAGQSNAVGYGRGVFHDPPELGVHVLRADETWTLATHPLGDSTDTTHPVNREFSNPAHSPWLHFARIVKREMNFPIGFIPTALGGEKLALWNPVEMHPAPLFENMMHCVRVAGGRVKGVLWFQGETDSCDEEWATTYEKRFIAAAKSWRKALKNPALPILTAQIGRKLGEARSTPDERERYEIGSRRRTLIREAQRQAARKLANVVVMPTLDLPTSDAGHLSPSGNILLGERLARAALAEVYGRPQGEYSAPDLQSAQRTADGKTIELEFAPVVSHMDCHDQHANCFRVEDEGGPVSIARIIYPGSAKIILELARSLEGTTQVHGGYGLDPALLPFDIERQMPILAFYGAPII